MSRFNRSDKVKKFRTPKQELATERNFAKFRLTGFCIGEKALTEKEKNILNAIKNNIKVLLNEWDEGSKELGLKPLPLYEIETTYSKFITKNKKEVSVYRDELECKVTKIKR